ncbi:hypothetical protein O4H26_06545 [Aequorivita viscosa]|nr:hypothetical protein [Aequorivita viscosa]
MFKILNIIGTIKGITYYRLNGEYVKRKSSPPSRDKILFDPRFTTVKANVTEFAAANMLAKSIYTGLQENVKIFKDSYFTSRLTGCCRKIIQKGRGTKGQREANVFNLPDALIGFQLHKKQIFNQIYWANKSILPNNARSNITVNIKNSSPIDLRNCPKSATHFVLTAVISSVSVHTWNRKIKKYQTTYPAANALGDTVQTPPLLCRKEHQDLNLELNMPTKKSIPSNVAITVWLGIQYGKKIDNIFTSFVSGKAMECIAIV